ncbi:uncharacterized protein LOC111092560 isoform X4 [Canis lupus familiaris]|uniref:uncharacterized protein LOC111092560 isoform X4 n=1 Tax=Canis lupus familiaris TaxID=9615 RepID=UPI000BAA092D|nr:uncharacterized protein LOC111092560 isoform X4 [Canis lupus familiaris]XP_025303834.1 uncharacterized protein LOC112660503 isoform X4 [Canis lupus dingo]XP_038385554.1 uncharacterized protein LOC111092560 isoform X4 [Canis lupus familiaris]XP_038513871.1 uncharacterized protein LOC111092560 isoform X4 [Canis lupus familiaris]|eukprot:XP_022266126.1 uncharacterized protein LOC111092560 isoform X4 [Canis lupus familiaris]
MTPDPHAEVLRGGAGAPWAALVPEQLRFLEPDVVHGSWELSKSRETHQAVPAGKQAEGGRRPRDEPAADGLHTAPGAHRAGALTWCHPYLLSCILRSEVTAATVSWVHEPQKRGAAAVHQPHSPVPAGTVPQQPGAPRAALLVPRFRAPWTWMSPPQTLSHGWRRIAPGSEAAVTPTSSS